MLHRQGRSRPPRHGPNGQGTDQASPKRQHKPSMRPVRSMNRASMMNNMFGCAGGPFCNRKCAAGVVTCVCSRRLRMDVFRSIPATIVTSWCWRSWYMQLLFSCVKKIVVCPSCFFVCIGVRFSSLCLDLQAYLHVQWLRFHHVRT